MSALYHGSKTEGLKELTPHGTGVLSGEEAVFSTPDKGLALSYLAPWKDSDFAQGSVNDNPLTMRELRPGAFEDIYGGKSGSLYHLAEEGFTTDDRLMPNERISLTSQEVQREERIGDILAAMRDSGMLLRTHDQPVDYDIDPVDMPEEKQSEDNGTDMAATAASGTVGAAYVAPELLKKKRNFGARNQTYQQIMDQIQPGDLLNVRKKNPLRFLTEDKDPVQAFGATLQNIFSDPSASHNAIVGLDPETQQKLLLQHDIFGDGHRMSVEEYLDASKPGGAGWFNSEVEILRPKNKKWVGDLADAAEGTLNHSIHGTYTPDTTIPKYNITYPAIGGVIDNLIPDVAQDAIGKHLGEGVCIPGANNRFCSSLVSDIVDDSMGAVHKTITMPKHIEQFAGFEPVATTRNTKSWGNVFDDLPLAKMAVKGAIGAGLGYGGYKLMKNLLSKNDGQEKKAGVPGIGSGPVSFPLNVASNALRYSTNPSIENTYDQLSEPMFRRGLQGKDVGPAAAGAFGASPFSQPLDSVLTAEGMGRTARSAFNMLPAEDHAEALQRMKEALSDVNVRQLPSEWRPAARNLRSLSLEDLASDLAQEIPEAAGERYGNVFPDISGMVEGMETKTLPGQKLTPKEMAKNMGVKAYRNMPSLAGAVLGAHTPQSPTLGFSPSAAVGSMIPNVLSEGVSDVSKHVVDKNKVKHLQALQNRLRSIRDSNPALVSDQAFDTLEFVRKYKNPEALTYLDSDSGKLLHHAIQDPDDVSRIAKLVPFLPEEEIASALAADPIKKRPLVDELKRGLITGLTDDSPAKELSPKLKKVRDFGIHAAGNAVGALTGIPYMPVDTDIAVNTAKEVSNYPIAPAILSAAEQAQFMGANLGDRINDLERARPGGNVLQELQKSSPELHDILMTYFNDPSTKGGHMANSIVPDELKGILKTNLSDYVPDDVSKQNFQEMLNTLQHLEDPVDSIGTPASYAIRKLKGDVPTTRMGRFSKGLGKFMGRMLRKK